MTRTLLSFACLATSLCLLAPGRTNAAETGDGPHYSSDGRLQFPAQYREWVFLSSGLGMTYGPMAAASRGENPPFDNVFADRAAYKAFMASGSWPDKTMLVLEVRSSLSKGSINQGGHFQSEPLAVEVHVKDEKRFPGKWAFFGFDKRSGSARQIPVTADCYSCHAQHGAVDTTFVQFYPTLIGVAKDKGSLKQ